MQELNAYFQRQLPLVNERLAAEAAGLQGLVRGVAEHVLLSGGKRIRPVLTILFARLLGYGGDPLPLACALEMLHSATLIHDDVLDGARLRRGRDAAHVAFGTTEAILAGDVLLALANRLGADYGNPRVCLLLAEGIMATAQGEVLELTHIGNPVAARDAYLEIVTGKTARLIEAACRLGAALAGADRPREDAAGAYGLNLGIAFQLVDDALDYDQGAETLGKPAAGDLREGKLTLPLILLLEDLPAAERSGVLERLRSGELSNDERDVLLARVREGGYAERTRQAAAEYVDTALKALDALPEGEKRTVLGQAAEYVLARRK